MNRSSRRPGDLFRRQDAKTRRGQLERERQSVEAPTDLRDRRTVLDIELEPRNDGPRTIDEQLHGLRLLGAAPVGFGQRQRRQSHAVSAVTPSASRVVAITRSVGARAQQEIGKRGARVHQMLAVVEHEEERPRADEPCESIGGTLLPLGIVANGRRVEHRFGDEARVAHRREIDPHACVASDGRFTRDDFHREARLAASAGSRERKQPRRRQEPTDRVDFLFAADEARELGRDSRYA